MLKIIFLSFISLAFSFELEKESFMYIGGKVDGKSNVAASKNCSDTQVYLTKET